MTLSVAYCPNHVQRNCAFPVADNVCVGSYKESIMPRARRPVWVALIILMSAASTGCSEAVGTAARGSLASFLTQVFSTAVNAALTGT